MAFNEQNGSSWMEYVSRAKRTFMGFTIYKNQVFGRDAKSPFILTNLSSKAGGERGLNATVLLYRLDPKRGWVPVWERSRTTEAAIKLYRQRNPYAHSSYEDASAKRNRLAEVKGTKYFVLLA